MSERPQIPSRIDLHRAAEAQLQGIAGALGQILPPGVVFTLITFTPGPGGYAGYVSSARREDMITALKEMVERLEAGSTSGPFADIEELHSRKNRHQRRRAGRDGKGQG